ncbi:hypothetical protein PHLCEN_2v3535 [Hermanssonia centrifuga]|uniref:Uncharacterized protein n=1 Tax=Hermanssonia centrifuga TaxID=98765 RepID=A0A2R6QEV1_9APHY|nr:hypothetical protein PHLCEN_2v3535 [Hermanssonia centrifuga]
MPRSRRVLSSDESGSEDEAANVNSKKANKKSLHIAGETPIETTKRVHKATEKQLYSDTRVEQAKENEQGKQIKKLQHELDRLKKQKRTAQHTNNNDSSRLGDKGMSDLPPESEEEDNYVSPFQSRGVVEVKAPAKKKLAWLSHRQSTRGSSPEAALSSSRDISPHSRGQPSTHSSSRISIATSPPRSPSPPHEDEPSRRRSRSPAANQQINDQRGRSPAPILNIERQAHQR